MLTLVVTYHPNLYFAAIYSGYAEGLSMEDIQSIGESLLPHARSVSEQVSARVGDGRSPSRHGPKLAWRECFQACG